MNTHIPHIFSWQIKQWHYLQQRLQQNRLPHAILFSGAAGLGKTQFANAFIYSLLCEQKKEDGHGCGHCRSCLWLQAHSHPDLFVVQPEEESVTIKIEMIRGLIDRLTQQSHQGGYKIALISPAEAMPIGATNALLKTLEEPTPNTIILLITQQLYALTATLRSRCQLLSFQAPDNVAAETWLAQQLPAAQEHIQTLLALSDGAPLNALKMHDGTQLQERQDLLQQLEQLLTQSSNPLKIAAKWTEKPLLETLALWQHWLAYILRSYFQLDQLTMIDKESQIIINKISKKVDPIALCHFYDKTNLLRRQLLEKYNPNVLLALEDLFCAWAELH